MSYLQRELPWRTQQCSEKYGTTMGIVAWFRSLSPKQLLNSFKNISNAAKDAPPESLIFATILAWAKLSRDQKFSLMFGWSIKVSPSKIQDIFEPTSCEITWNHYNSPRIHVFFFRFGVPPFILEAPAEYPLGLKVRRSTEIFLPKSCPSKKKMATLSQVMISASVIQPNTWNV